MLCYDNYTTIHTFWVSKISLYFIYLLFIGKEINTFIQEGQFDKKLKLK